MDALPFLAAAKAPSASAIYALAGDEDFLKRLARERIIATALGGEDPEFAVASTPATSSTSPPSATTSTRCRSSPRAGSSSSRTPTRS